MLLFRIDGEHWYELKITGQIICILLSLSRGINLIVAIITPASPMDTFMFLAHVHNSP